MPRSFGVRMGFFDIFRPSRSARVGGEAVQFAPTFMFTSDDVAHFVAGAGVGNLTPERIYEKTQLRTVLDFRARNFSQIGMHAYRRVDDGGRERDRESKAAALLARPAPGLTWFELMWALCLDYDLHARTFLLYNPNLNAVLHIPARRVSLVSGSWELGDFRAEIQPVDPAGKPVTVDARSLIPFQVYNPGGKSPMESLKETMQEQAEAKAFRRATWANGHQSNRYIHRPKDAPPWTPEGRDRFIEQMRAFKAGGGQQGGTPVLDDGMEIRSDAFKAVEDQVVEMAKLSREEYAAAYGVTLSMLGSPDGNSYANLKEYRRQLYGETLGPMFKMVEDRLNAFLLPLTDPGDDGALYLEFNVKERLKSDPVDQAKVYQASVGAPIMTRNEARARENLPAVEGGDELITPLNVATGAVASPLDTAPDKNPLALSGSPLEERAAWEDDPALWEARWADEAGRLVEMRSHVDGLSDRGGVVPGKTRKPELIPHVHPGATARITVVLRQYFDRQSKTILSDFGAGNREVDYDRWAKELEEDLNAALPPILDFETRLMMTMLMMPAGSWNPNRSRVLSPQEIVRLFASDVSTSVLNRLIKSDDPAGEYKRLHDQRSIQYSQTLLGYSLNRRGMDVARQGAEAAGGYAKKTWIVRSSDVRPAHVGMHGEKVRAHERFSNGAHAPRDPILGAAGVANCRCAMLIEIEDTKE